MRLAIAMLMVAVSLSAGTRAIFNNCCSTQTSYSVADGSTGQVTHTFELGLTSFDSALSGDGRSLFVVVFGTAAGSNLENPIGIASVDVETNRHSATVGLPSDFFREEQIVANPQKPIFYLVYSDSAILPHVAAIDGKTLNIIQNIALPPYSGESIFVSPKGDHLIVPGQGATGALLLDAVTLQTIDTILPTFSLGEIQETQDQTKLFVFVNTAEPGIVVIDIPTKKEIAFIPIPFYLLGFLISYDSANVYLVNAYAVTIVNVATLASHSYSPSNVQFSGNAVQSPDGSKIYLELMQENTTPGFETFDVAASTFTRITTAFPEKIFVEPNGKLVLQDLEAGSAFVTQPVPSLASAATFATGFDVGAPAWDEDSRKIFLPHILDGFIQAIDDQHFQPAGFIRFRQFDYCIYVVTHDGYGYAGVHWDGPGGNAYISKFDTASFSKIGIFNLPPIASGNVTYLLGGAVSPDGTRFYAPYVYGPFDVGGLLPVAPDPSASVRGSDDPQSGLAVFDTASGELLNVFPQVSFATPAIAPSGTVGYVPVVNSDSSIGIDKIDLSTGATISSISLGQGTPQGPPPLSGPFISPDGSKIYAVIQHDVLLIMNPDTLAIERSATIAALNGGLSLSPDGRYFYSSQLNGIFVIDLSSFQVVNSIPLQGLYVVPSSAVFF